METVEKVLNFLGYEVEALDRAYIEEHRRVDLLRSYGLEPRNRLLFVGPPGNGKTTFALRLVRTFTDMIYIPFAVAVEGQMANGSDGKDSLKDEVVDREDAPRVGDFGARLSQEVRYEGPRPVMNVDDVEGDMSFGLSPKLVKNGAREEREPARVIRRVGELPSPDAVLLVEAGKLDEEELHGLRRRAGT